MFLRLLTLLILFALGSIAHAEPGAPPGAPQRIISMGPNLTETVYALGVGDRLVGVSDFCNWPPEARALPRCGGYLDPNYEVLSALRPDLILAQGRHHQVEGFAKGRNVRVLMLEIDTVDQIFSGIERLGEVLQRQDAATSLTRQLRQELEQADRRLAGIPAEQRPAVFLGISRRLGTLDQISTVGSASFLGEILELAGGRNIFADIKQPYPQVSKESLLSRRPEVIIELMPELTAVGDAKREQFRRDWQALGSLPAVRNDRIEIITDEYMLTPGPRFTQVIERIQAAIYPDRVELPQSSANVTSATLSQTVSVE